MSFRLWLVRSSSSFVSSHFISRCVYVASRVLLFRRFSFVVRIFSLLGRVLSFLFACLLCSILFFLVSFLPFRFSLGYFHFFLEYFGSVFACFRFSCFFQGFFPGRVFFVCWSRFRFSLVSCSCASVLAGVVAFFSSAFSLLPRFFPFWIIHFHSWMNVFVFCSCAFRFPSCGFRFLLVCFRFSRTFASHLIFSVSRSCAFVFPACMFSFLARVCFLY